MLKVNGTEITAPKTYQANVLDIDGESNRNANGNLIRDRITTKRKLEMEWGPLSQDEISTLLSAVSDASFSVTFLDPMLGNVTKTMYVGDRTAPAYVYDSDSGEMKWKSLKMDFIEI
jgi:hypothetical protein